MADTQSERTWGEEPGLVKVLHWYKLFESTTPPRLGMDIERRLPLTALTAFSVGLGVGANHGARKAAYQFRAENAHRFPTTSTGWFQYHKTKNYKAIVGGVFDGFKLGSRLGVGAMAFVLFEETVDCARRDRRDFISTVVAGLSFSGIYSLIGKSALICTPVYINLADAALLSSSSRYLHCRPNDKIGTETELGLRVDPGCSRYDEGQSSSVHSISVRAGCFQRLQACVMLGETKKSVEQSMSRSA